MWHQTPLRRVQALALRQIGLGRRDQLLGDDAVLDDLAVVVDVVDEQVERVNPLLQPALDRSPIRCRR